MPNMSLKKNEMPSQAPDVRNKNFLEVTLGYTPEQAVDEASAERDEVPQIAKSEKPSLLAKLQRPLPCNKAVETKNNELEGR